MRGRTAMSVMGVVAFVAMVLATATIWLLLAEPARVTEAATSGEITPLVAELARALSSALHGLLAYL